jgi:acyl carrier protein phosphodiesterase
MNYLSHLFFSQRTPMSLTGNLMGDFRRNIDIQTLPEEIVLGIKNHHFVDRQTDSSNEMKQLKTLFSSQRRRFAGVIIDLSFDYFLIKHWAQFSNQGLEEFIQECYAGLQECDQYMPERMQRAVRLMIQHRWLQSYATLDGLEIAINQVAKRIRFKNDMAGGIVEVSNNYQEFDEAFLSLFPKLQASVVKAGIELSSEKPLT